ncbi:MCE family protein [Mycobacterium sp. pUA109]|uniref:MCE family protein n=1 Tax=Mycobacterium sp. pUA109 TaxID=3238982 RepID=UPI00351BDFC4
MRNKLTRLIRPLDAYNATWLGAVALVVLGVLLLGVVGYGQLNIGKTTYHGEFVQAAQIKKGDGVTIAGIQVGAVDGVKLAGDHVVVKFSVRNGVRLGADTRAGIKLTTILGSRYLELSPAGAGSLPQRTIPLRWPNGDLRTEVPYDLTATLAGATKTFGPLDADRVVESVNVLDANLQGLPEALPPALQNLQSLADVIGDRRDQLGALLNNADTLTTMLANQRADLGVLIVQGRDLLREIATRRAAVQRLFASATTLVQQAKTIMADEPALDKLLGDAQEFTKMVNDHDALVRSLLQSSPVAVRNLANATGSGNALDVNAPMGILIDSWACAISSRAPQFNLVEYFKDCE